MTNKLRILMVGPVVKTGGVSTHIKSLVNILKRDESLELLVYNSSFESKLPKIVVFQLKLYKRTLGLFFSSLKKRRLFDIIHVQASGGLPSFLSAITSALFAALFRKKFIITFHHSDTAGFVRKYKGLVRFVLNKTNCFIVVSNHQKNIFLNYFSCLEKFKVIPNGYSAFLFKPYDMVLARKKLNLPVDKKILLNIANLEEYKGQKFLIQAIIDVVKVRKDVKLYIVGRGPLQHVLQSQIIEERLQDFISLAGGNKPREEIPLWINACNVFVLSSLNEGNPTVMFECLGCGKPFVGTTVGGIPEIITNERLGYLVEPKDVHGLSNVILKALGKDGNREYILNYAKQFTWDEIAKRTKSIYYESIDGDKE